MSHNLVCQETAFLNYILCSLYTVCEKQHLFFTIVSLKTRFMLSGLFQISITLICICISKLTWLDKAE